MEKDTTVSAPKDTNNGEEKRVSTVSSVQSSAVKESSATKSEHKKRKSSDCDKTIPSHDVVKGISELPSKKLKNHSTEIDEAKKKHKRSQKSKRKSDSNSFGNSGTETSKQKEQKDNTSKVSKMMFDLFGSYDDESD